MEVDVQSATVCQWGLALSAEQIYSRVVEHVGLKQDLVDLSAVLDLKPFAGG
jgi:hypothetical protein